MDNISKYSGLELTERGIAVCNACKSKARLIYLYSIDDFKGTYKSVLRCTNCSSIIFRKDFYGVLEPDESKEQEERKWEIQQENSKGENLNTQE